MSQHTDPSAPDTTIDLGGGLRVTAITDAVAEHGKPLEECFPGAPRQGWEAVKRLHPGTIGIDGRWKLPITVFLVQTAESTMLVDAGVGCPGTLATEVFHVVGTLPLRLARLGVAVEDVDTVLFTHLHEDHLGWAADPDTGEPHFPRARYAIAKPEWEAVHAAGGPPEWVQQSLEPVHQRGRVDLVELGRLSEGLELVALPGHTPGHCGLVLTGPEGSVTLVGDAYNHPLQVAEPDVPSIADADRKQATATRGHIAEQVTSGRWQTLGSAHLPGAWWAPASTEDGLVWQPRSPAPERPAAAGPDDVVSRLGLRLANLRTGSGLTLGVLQGERVLDVTATARALGLPAPADVDELLRDGTGAAVRAVLAAATDSPGQAVDVPLALATFGPVVSRPEKIVCIGFNYQRHAEETDTPIPDAPPLFAKYANALAGHRATIELPVHAASRFDYETELVIVIGRRCHKVSEARALDVVAGYATGNDFSARDLQTATTQFTAGKASDGFAPIGPWLVTADLVPDPNALRLQTWVNGEQRQDWTTQDMIYSCRKLISYVSDVTVLEPGDAIFTGTPQGVIFGQDAPPEERRWLRAGDVVTSEVEGLGQLTVTLA